MARYREFYIEVLKEGVYRRRLDLRTEGNRLLLHLEFDGKDIHSFNPGKLCIPELLFEIHWLLEHKVDGITKISDICDTIFPYEDNYPYKTKPVIK